MVLNDRISGTECLITASSPLQSKRIIPTIPFLTRTLFCWRSDKCIFKELSRLQDNRFFLSAELFKGRDAWRIRVGDYRAIYEINDGRLIVTVTTIGYRREVYE